MSTASYNHNHNHNHTNHISSSRSETKRCLSLSQQQPSNSHQPTPSPVLHPQPNSTTRLSQLQKWSSLIQSWCRHHRIYRLSLIEAIESPLFHNAALRKRLSLSEARAVLDWMAKPEEEGVVDGGRNGSMGERPEEWAGIVADWVEATGQKNVVLTVYELLEGEATMSQEWHGMDADVMLKSLNVLVKRGKAQVFGSEGQEGVKFF
ncbi:ESCRT-II subunit protein VPS25 [Aspergillus novofumigatus IBT 16806]|uniref:ESCRT-II complex subunit VPS25 n=1 Tax=Aspergillus novofumigatus (strain IBT 16806) TaxID=1392255 RepID=A0A2I1C4K6_ASPN1|nr:ESCRT-II-domain-containing protein [Aspergillus novofumigatus IBT 16806]PKX92559.1 ESCRT-II-domain-containing protein [Aspergillus novofumigatus IBT 16806]